MNKNNHSELMDGRTATTLSLILALGVFIFQAYAYLSGVTVQPGQLVDADCYTRLLRVEHLAETGSWFNPEVPRSNPTVPETSQWSRWVDLALLAGGLALTPFYGFHTGLFIWGATFSPVMLLFCAAAMLWASAAFLSPRARFFAVLFLHVQPGILLYLSFGRPDHHGVLLLLLILILGCCVRVFLDPARAQRWAIAAGLLQALALTISIEALFSTFLGLIITGWFWLSQGKHSLALARNYSLSLFLGCCVGVALAISPSHWTLTEVDRLAPAHLIAFGSVALFWFMLKRFDLQPRCLPNRILLGLGGAVLSVSITAALVPNLFQNPQLTHDPRIGKLWLDSIVEYHHLAYSWKELPFQLFLWLGPWLVIVPLMLRDWLRSSFQFQEPVSTLTTKFYLLLGCLFFGILSIYQARWVTYAEVFVVLPWAYLLNHLLEHFEQRPIQALSLSLLRSGLTLAFTFSFLLIGLVGLALLSPKKQNTTQTSSAKKGNQIQLFAQWLNGSDFQSATPETILALFDLGPELLYRTHHNVIATPNHRNADGMIFYYDTLNADPSERIHERLQSRGVSLILLSATSSEKSFLAQSGKADTFYHQLMNVAVPPYLKQLTLPAELSSDFKLFRVLP
ncbi:MAG: hypothetical protein SH807_05405 [Blastochloris sp.]|nr:hypothetical protein [Blastochloris sp.]